MSSHTRRGESNRRKQHYSHRTILLPIVLTLLLSGCALEATEKIKREIITAAAMPKPANAYLDLSRLVDGRVLKLCIQNQYMISNSFTELTQMDSPGFKEASEGEFVLWIYLELRPPIQLRFTKSEIAPTLCETPCTINPVIRVSNGALSFNCPGES